MVYTIDFSAISDEELKNHHDMMNEAVEIVAIVSPLAVGLWSKVLKELDTRGLVQLGVGTYDDPMNVGVIKS